MAFADDLFPEERMTAQAGGLAEERVQLLEEVRRFRAFGAETIERVEEDIPYFVNEFWTSAQRQAHSIHEISYRACFKPQLPAFFIDRLTVPGETVHDPFMGRGTTPVQAALMRRVPSAADINPLSALLTRPRLNPPSLQDIARRVAQLPWGTPTDIRTDLLAFYHPETLRDLTTLRDWLLREAPLREARPDPVVDWIRMVALNRLTGHSPGFFSVYSLPPNQAVSVESQLKINAKRGQTPPRRDVARLILKKSKSLLADGRPPATDSFTLVTEPASRSPTITSASAALVVTSPPFLDIVQYADDNWLRCWFAGVDINGVDIAMHRTEAAWQAMVHDVLSEQARIVRPGGHIAFEVGEVRRGKVLLERLVWQACEQLPFERMGVIVNQQEFTKTANCWGVSNNSGGTNTNRIVMLRRQ